MPFGRSLASAFLFIAVLEVAQTIREVVPDAEAIVLSYRPSQFGYALSEHSEHSAAELPLPTQSQRNER
jgi:hypothetical protein